MITFREIWFYDEITNDIFRFTSTPHTHSHPHHPPTHPKSAVDFVSEK